MRFLPDNLAGVSPITEFRESGLPAAAAFFWQWVQHPRETGAISPSSPFLARAMAREAVAAGDGMVIELGAGTGVITQALVDAGVTPERLLIVEKNPALAASLRRRFADARIIEGDATQIDRMMRLHDGLAVSAIVSGLPLILFDLRQQYVLLKKSFDLLKPAGRFLQFTYGPALPVPRQIPDRLGLRAERAAFILRNVPPATLWRFERARLHP